MGFERISAEEWSVCPVSLLSRQKMLLTAEDNEGRIKGKETETLYLKDGLVKFNDIKSQEFMMAWLADVADIGDCDDTEK